MRKRIMKILIVGTLEDIVPVCSMIKNHRTFAAPNAVIGYRRALREKVDLVIIFPYIQKELSLTLKKYRPNIKQIVSDDIDTILIKLGLLDVITT